MNEKNKILVEAQSLFLEDKSSPEEGSFVFSYTITITNAGEIPAMLRLRHWIVTDSNGKIDDICGPGVVGEHPYLKPGQSFRYTSVAMIATPVGTMKGHYTMHSDDGNEFLVKIPQFTLSIPRTLH